MNYLQLARDQDPLGSLCSFCEGPNTFADDCGWFYINPFPINYKDWEKEYREGGFCCEKCWNSWIGRAHVSKFGLGER